MKRVEENEFIQVRTTVNGRSYTFSTEARVNLADALRYELGLLGTKVGCEHGVCGACTIILDGRLARSCSTLAVQVEGAELTTIEGLATDERLDRLRDAFSRHGALQCGFCTPGVLASTSHFLKHYLNPDEAQVRDMLSGHLCRCTGYDGMVRAILEFAEGEIE